MAEIDPESIEIAVAEAVDKAVQAVNLPALCRPKPRKIAVSGNVFEVEDPAFLGFPPTLPLELALGDQPRIEILKAYSLTPESWDKLRRNPVFQKALAAAVETLQRDGMSFKLKAKLQSEALLETSWHLIHSPHTPSAVKADLIKHTHKMAGFEPKEEAKVVNPLQININLG